MASAAALPSLWSSFWREFAVEGQAQERCHVPGDGRPAVDGHWAAFADALPAGARVLDLGCGAGVVGSALLAGRGDLHVTGVDWANVPAPPLPSLEILPHVAMEALPFAPAGFDAAVSLFGIEYGDIARTAPELARVLKPDAPFSFLVHHADSEILREGTLRRRALRDLFSGKPKSAYLAGNAASFERERLRLRQAYPGEPSIRLFTDYFRRLIVRPRLEREATWHKLAGDLDPEIALLAHLERSAKSAQSLGAWLAPLLALMREVQVTVLRRRSGEPIAWSVRGAR